MPERFETWADYRGLVEEVEEEERRAVLIGHDPRVMPEMVEAGVDALLEALPSHLEAATPGLRDAVCEIFRAMEDARPPGYYAKLIKAMRADYGLEP